MNAGVRFVAADVDVFRILCAAELCHDIFWKVNENRSRFSGAGNVEGFFDDASEIFTVSYRHAVFRDAAGDADNINLLECIVSDEVAGYLSGEADKRNAVVVCRCKTGDQVGCTRAAGNEAYADFSCRSRIGIRLMHQRLLVARQNDFDFILFVKLIADINGASSRITEEILDTLLLQSLYQKFVSCNLFHMKTSCSKFAA